MRRGPKISDATVVAHVDGTGIPQDIEDSIDDAGPGAERAGRRLGDRMGDRFSKGFDKVLAKAIDRAGKKLAENIAGAGDEAGENFYKRFEKSADKIGKRVSKRFGKEMREALGEVVEDFARMLDTVELSGVSGNRSPSESGPSGPNVGLSQKLAKDQYNLFKFLGKEKVRLAKAAEAEIAKIEKDRAKEQAALLKQATRDHDLLWKVRRASADAYSKYLDGVNKKETDVFGNRIRRGGVGGRREFGFLGQGSRNNALNLFGSITGGIAKTLTNLPSLLGKAQGAAQGLFNTFQKGFNSAGDQAGTLTKTVNGFGAVGAQAFSSLAASGPAAIAVIVAVSASLIILTSVVNGLIAAVTALAATVASALVGALAVAGGLVVALTASVGLLVLAFTAMTNAQKDALSSAFAPLKDMATGLGQVMLNELVPAFATWSQNLQDALYLLEPLARVMGGAFAEAGNILTASLSGPGFQKLFDALGSELPTIVENLSLALADFGNGFAAMFAAIMPYVTDFSKYLAGVARDFSKWANSAEGQNSISNFVDRALTALRSLWSFVTAVGGLLKRLLFSPEGQNAGNSIFDDMTNAVRNFAEYISKENRLQDWFDQGVEMAQVLGKTIKALGNLFAELNNAGVIEFFSQLVSFGGWLIDVFRDLPKPIQYFIMPLKGIIDLVSKFAKIIKDGTTALKALDRAGKLDGLKTFVGAAKGAVTWIGRIVGAVSPAVIGLKTLANVMNGIGNLFNRITGQAQAGSKSLRDWNASVKNIGPTVPGSVGSANAAEQRNNPGTGAAAPASKANTASDLITKGDAALKNTYEKYGGDMPNPKTGEKKKPKYKNPYIDFANKLINDGPSVAAQVRNAIIEQGEQVAKTINSVASSTNSDSVTNSLENLSESMLSAAEQTVNTAQSALNSSAQTLANATTKKAAKKALKEVKQDQKDLAAAQKAQQKLNKASALLLAQSKTTNDLALSLVGDEATTGSLAALGRVQNNTLADFAATREKVAGLLQDANQKLSAAIQLRDGFIEQVSNSIQAFGALTTAQAKTINGVQQALTAADITENLQQRLEKIRTFQSDLRLLLAMGLNNTAYEQLLTMGVEGGSEYAKALLEGGAGAVAQTNQLLTEVGSIADNLGQEAGNRMYQAGVDAAQGLVDGLMSLDQRLTAAAEHLGDTIANAIKKSLGIASPSRRMIDDMDDVGDGVAIGLGNQRVKVGTAASALASMIRVSPEVAAQAAAERQSPYVSGNGANAGTDARFRDLIVNTPTENPEAVAMEVLNEVVGRL